MNIKNLVEIIEKNLLDKTYELKRVFHGRGGFYEDFNYLTVDSIDSILFACFYDEVKDEDKIIKQLTTIAINYNFKKFIIQKRYLKCAPCQIIFGELNENEIAIENDLKYSINFLNKNIGIFPDMKIGRDFIQNISKNKTVLNLFSYTCAFSINAIEGGAKKVVNVDMSKSALSIGRKNHHLNGYDTKKVKFLPYNILKSWSRIRREGPYDIIIIDPPSFQKGSFAATKDYEKIIKRLDELTKESCTVLSCLNAPELDEEFIKNIFNKNAINFNFLKRLNNLYTFPSKDTNRDLKNLVYAKI